MEKLTKEGNVLKVKMIKKVIGKEDEWPLLN